MQKLVRNLDMGQRGCNFGPGTPIREIQKPILLGFQFWQRENQSPNCSLTLLIGDEILELEIPGDDVPPQGALEEWPLGLGSLDYFTWIFRYFKFNSSWSLFSSLLGSENLILTRLVATNVRETDRPRLRRNWAERATSGLGCLTLIRSDMPNVFTRENYPHRCLQGGRQGCQEIDMKLGLKKFVKELLLQNLF